MERLYCCCHFDFKVHETVWNLQAEPSTAESSKGGEAADPAERLRNQFNFSERGAQTTYFQLRERETSTDTPETVEASGTCSHWEIYDAYVADQRMQRQQVREQGGLGLIIAIVENMMSGQL